MLSDPNISTRDLIALRELARAAHSGMLTVAEAANGISRINPAFTKAFSDIATAAAVIEVIDVILQARSPAAAKLSRTERYKLKAVECLQLADNARHVQTAATYESLAACYEQLALQAEEIEKREANEAVRVAETLLHAQELEVERMRRAGLNVSHAETLLSAYRAALTIANERRRALLERKTLGAGL